MNYGVLGGFGNSLFFESSFLMVALVYFCYHINNNKFIIK